MGKILDVAIWILYPLIVFCGLTYFGVRLTAIVLLLFVGRRFIVLLLSHRSTSRLVLLQASLMAIIIAGAAASGSAFVLRITPFVVSLTFIAMFAFSLSGTPLIERFARLQEPELSPAKITYCRNLTKFWVGVLAANSGLLLFASLCQSEALWAILVGPVSYGMLGMVFAIEYPLRKWRFQDFDEKSVIDRLLKPILGSKNTR
jgi:uncharacterized membrane protein